MQILLEYIELIKPYLDDVDVSFLERCLREVIKGNDNNYRWWERKDLPRIFKRVPKDRREKFNKTVKQMDLRAYSLSAIPEYRQGEK